MRILKGAPLAFTSGAWTSCATELQMPLTALRNVDDWTWCRWTWHAKMCMKGTPKTDNTIDLGDPPQQEQVWDSDLTVIGENVIVVRRGPFWKIP